MMTPISYILLICSLSLLGYVEETQEKQVGGIVGDLQGQ